MHGRRSMGFAGVASGRTRFGGALRCFFICGTFCASFCRHSMYIMKKKSKKYFLLFGKKILIKIFLPKILLLHHLFDHFLLFVRELGSPHVKTLGMQSFDPGLVCKLLIQYGLNFWC